MPKMKMRERKWTTRQKEARDGERKRKAVGWVSSSFRLYDDVDDGSWWWWMQYPYLCMYVCMHLCMYVWWDGREIILSLLRHSTARSLLQSIPRPILKKFPSILKFPVGLRTSNPKENKPTFSIFLLRIEFNPIFLISFLLLVVRVCKSRSLIRENPYSVYSLSPSLARALREEGSVHVPLLDSKLFLSVFILCSYTDSLFIFTPHFVFFNSQVGSIEFPFLLRSSLWFFFLWLKNHSIHVRFWFSFLCVLCFWILFLFLQLGLLFCWCSAITRVFFW